MTPSSVSLLSSNNDATPDTTTSNERDTLSSYYNTYYAYDDDDRARLNLYSPATATTSASMTSLHDNNNALFANNHQLQVEQQVSTTTTPHLVQPFHLPLIASSLYDDDDDNNNNDDDYYSGASAASANLLQVVRYINDDNDNNKNSLDDAAAASLRNITSTTFTFYPGENKITGHSSSSSSSNTTGIIVALANKTVSQFAAYPSQVRVTNAHLYTSATFQQHGANYSSITGENAYGDGSAFYPNGEPHLAKWLVIILAVIMSFMCMVTIVGNLLILHSLRIEKRLHTVSNIFIGSLAIADLIVGVFVMPLSTYYILNEFRWSLGLFTCQLWLAMDYVASTASIFNLFALSLDRFWSITSPLKYLKRRTKKRALVMVGIVWAASALWTVPVVFGHYVFNGGMRLVPHGVCDTEFLNELEFKIFTAIINFYLPLIVMLCLYGKIFAEIRKQALTFQPGTKHKGGGASSTSDRSRTESSSTNHINNNNNNANNPNNSNNAHNSSSADGTGSQPVKPGESDKNGSVHRHRVRQDDGGHRSSHPHRHHHHHHHSSSRRQIRVERNDFPHRSSDSSTSGKQTHQHHRRGTSTTDEAASLSNPTTNSGNTLVSIRSDTLSLQAVYSGVIIDDDGDSAGVKFKRASTTSSGVGGDCSSSQATNTTNNTISNNRHYQHSSSEVGQKNEAVQKTPVKLATSRTSFLRSLFRSSKNKNNLDNRKINQPLNNTYSATSAASAVVNAAVDLVTTTITLPSLVTPDATDQLLPQHKLENNNSSSFLPTIIVETFEHAVADDDCSGSSSSQDDQDSIDSLPMVSSSSYRNYTTKTSSSKSCTYIVIPSITVVNCDDEGEAGNVPTILVDGSNFVSTVNEYSIQPCYSNNNNRPAVHILPANTSKHATSAASAQLPEIVVHGDDLDDDERPVAVHNRVHENGRLNSLDRIDDDDDNDDDDEAFAPGATDDLENDDDDNDEDEPDSDDVEATQQQYKVISSPACKQIPTTTNSQTIKKQTTKTVASIGGVVGSRAASMLGQIQRRLNLTSSSALLQTSTNACGSFLTVPSKPAATVNGKSQDDDFCVAV